MDNLAEAIKAVVGRSTRRVDGDAIIGRVRCQYSVFRTRENCCQIILKEAPALEKAHGGKG